MLWMRAWKQRARNLDFHTHGIPVVSVPSLLEFRNFLQFYFHPAGFPYHSSQTRGFPTYSTETPLSPSPYRSLIKRIAFSGNNFLDLHFFQQWPSLTRSYEQVAKIFMFIYRVRGLTIHISLADVLVSSGSWSVNDCNRIFLALYNSQLTLGGHLIISPVYWIQPKDVGGVGGE
jgi:hypothetical protein